MNIIYSIILVFLPFALISAEATNEASGEPLWLTILGTVLTVVVTVLGGFLKKKWGAEENQAKIDATASLMEQKNFIIDHRVIPFAIDTAEHWVLTQIIPIVRDLSDGDGFDWGDHFDNLKKYVKNRVVKKFASENLDIIEMLGEGELDDILDRIITKIVSKLPDNIERFVPDRLVEIVSEKSSKWIMDKGKDLIRLD